MDEYIIALGDTRNIFRIFKYIEEIGHSKCHFSHPGSCTRIPFMHIQENQSKLHQKSANILGPIKEM